MYVFVEMFILRVFIGVKVIFWGDLNLFGIEKEYVGYRGIFFWVVVLDFLFYWFSGDSVLDLGCVYKLVRRIER